MAVPKLIHVVDPTLQPSGPKLWIFRAHNIYTLQFLRNLASWLTSVQTTRYTITDTITLKTEFIADSEAECVQLNLAHVARIKYKKEAKTNKRQVQVYIRLS